MDTENVIQGNPSKSFFIQMITRDISINDAIIDLIDNSIDAANKINSHDYNKFQIKITLDKEKFIIQDNCGGLSLETAQKYAFRFGRPDDAPISTGSVGRFGIGMKRALFKIGNKFEVESKTTSEHFNVNINLPEWKKKTKTIRIREEVTEIDDWDFNYQIISSNVTSNLREEGTFIIVTDLNEDVSNLFSDESFLISLENDIEKLLNLSLEKGIKITLNNKALSSKNISILYEIENNSTKPFYEEIEKDGVRIRVIAGLGDVGIPKASGWYIYCNDRLVLEADQSEITGWGTATIPKWHIDYVMFRGIVFFDAEETIKLPLTTTKKGVDATSNIYKTALALMKDALRQTVFFMRQVIKLENPQEYRELLIENVAKLSVTSLKNYNWEHSKNVFIPPILNFDSLAQKKDSVRIAYNIDLNRANIAKTHTESKSYKELGELTFNYFYKMEDLDNE